MTEIVKHFPAFDVDALDLSEVENFSPPSSNTGGNLVTPPQIAVFDHKSSQKCKIDYLSFTSRSTVAEMVHLMGAFVANMVIVDLHRGWTGYPCSAQIVSNNEVVGLMAWGADHGRDFVSFSGAACKHWTDYHVTCVHNLLAMCNGRITRIDYALDFYNGQVTYDDCEAALAAGEFQMKQGGRRASVDRHGSEGHYGNKGRTLYVGAASSSKRICMYEKGLEQFGKLPASWLENQTEADVVSYRVDGSKGMVGDVSVVEWLRAEVRYSNADRELDFDDYRMLFDRDEFFAGAYPFCARVLGLTDGVRPPTLLTDTEADIEKMKLNMKNSYGSFVHSLVKLGMTNDEIVECLDSGTVSKRLVKAGFFRHLETIVPF